MDSNRHSRARLLDGATAAAVMSMTTVVIGASDVTDHRDNDRHSSGSVITHTHTHTHMDCTVEPTDCFISDGSSHGQRVRCEMNKCEDMMNMPTLQCEHLDCGELFCHVVPRREQLQTPRLQLGTWTASQTDSGRPNRGA